MSQARRAVLDAVARRVPNRAPNGVRVGIDGVDGVGKTTFADHLAAVMHKTGRPVVRVSADDVQHPREVRHSRDRASPEGFWLDSFDCPTRAIWDDHDHVAARATEAGAVSEPGPLAGGRQVTGRYLGRP